MLNIIIPMAGLGTRFKEAGYAFPKPLIDVKGKPMIEVVIGNLKPKTEHRFIFICQKEHYDKYDLFNVFRNSVGNNNFEVVQINGITGGALCTVLTAAKFINNENEMIVANSDQYISADINTFIENAREGDKDGLIMTFKASHPKWSYARLGEDGQVIETAEKKVISNQATVGIYYFKHGRDFVKGAKSMIEKNIKHNNEFYVCPVYNELIMNNKRIFVMEIPIEWMHGLGTPEDLREFFAKIDSGAISYGTNNSAQRD